MRQWGYSLRSNIKRLIGRPHPDRDWQYCFLQRLKKRYRRHHQPVISVDTKKSERIGTFKNAGRRWCEQADAVNVYDFPSDAKAKAIPYGV